MSQHPSSDGIISEDDLKRLTNLFIQFEGAADPRSNACRESEFEFYAMIDRLFSEKVEPHFESINRYQFRSYTRRVCRQRASKIVPPFSCI